MATKPEVVVEQLKKLNEQIAAMEATIAVMKEAAKALEESIGSPVVLADDLPAPTDFIYESFKNRQDDVDDDEEEEGGEFEEITRKNDPATISIIELKTENTRKSAKCRKNRNRQDPKVAQLVCSEFASLLREFYRDYIKEELINKITAEESQVEMRISKELDKFLVQYNKNHGTSFAFCAGKTDAANGLIHKPHRKQGYWEGKFLESEIL